MARRSFHPVLFLSLIIAVLPLTTHAQSDPASSSEQSQLDCSSFNDDLRAEMEAMMGAELAPWTHFLKDAQTNTADIKKGTLAFPKQSNRWLHCVQRGDLLWAPAGVNGFLRRVVEISENTRQMVFQTNPAGFPDVILQGRVEVGSASRAEAVSERPPREIRDDEENQSGERQDPAVEKARSRLQELGYALDDDGFQRAVQGEPIEIVDLYLKAGHDPNATVDFIGTETPVLLFAAGNGLVEKTRLLLEAGADPDSRSKDGPLLASKVADQPAIVRLFIEHGADLERPEAMGLRPLHAAIYNNGYQQACVAESVRLLLEAGAIPNALTATPEGEKNPEGISPLMLAAQKGCYEAAEALLEGGADASLAHVSTNKTPADYAADGGHEALAKALREAASSAGDR